MVVKLEKTTFVSFEHSRKAKKKTPLPLIVVKLLRFTLARFVQYEKALNKATLPLIVVKLDKSALVKPVQYEKAYCKAYSFTSVTLLGKLQVKLLIGFWSFPFDDTSSGIPKGVVTIVGATL